MANYLRMQQVSAITALFEAGHGNKPIGRLLKIDPRTVRRYRRLWEAGELSSENDPNPPPGSGVAESSIDQNDPNLPPGPGPVSLCEPLRDVIEKKLENGQHGKSIYLDLVHEHRFEGSYDSLKRFLRRLRDKKPELVVRMQYPPGDAAQVDFGQGAPTLTPSGRKRRPHLFVMTLCWSREAYHEVVWDQKTETFLGCMRRALERFGGVPATVILDNLKAAVIRACWEDPVLNRHLQLFSEHYGFVPLPCHPASPKEKGLVENGVQYGQGILAGRSFEALEAQNQFLRHWENTVARKRIHGTTKMQVQAALELEKPHLKSLPAKPYEMIEIGYRRVHMDGRIEVKGAYYPIPEHLLGQQVEVHIQAHLIRVYEGGHQVIMHPRVEKGRTAPRTFAVSREVPTCRADFEKNTLQKAHELGPGIGAYADAVVNARGPSGYRFIQSFRRLEKRFGQDVLEQASREAQERGIMHSQAFVLLCNRIASERALNIELTQEDEIIRPLSEYTLIGG